MNEQRRAVLAGALDRLLPGGADGPGALELGAPAYVERALGAELAHTRAALERGLDRLDAAARERHGAGFAALGGAERDALLGACGELLETLRARTIEGCFGDPHWGGNAGGGGWALLGWPAPRTAWSEHEQELA